MQAYYNQFKNYIYVMVLRCIIIEMNNCKVMEKKIFEKEKCE